ILLTLLRQAMVTGLAWQLGILVEHVGQGRVLVEIGHGSPPRITAPLLGNTASWPLKKRGEGPKDYRKKVRSGRTPRSRGTLSANCCHVEEVGRAGALGLACSRSASSGAGSPWQMKAPQ